MFCKTCRYIHAGEKLEGESAGELLRLGESFDTIVGGIIDAGQKPLNFLSFVGVVAAVAE